MSNTHSLLGASGAKRWLNCAGSFLLADDLQEKGELEQKESFYALQGIAAHDLAADALREGKETFELMNRTYGPFRGTELDLPAIAIYVEECERFDFRNRGHKLIEATLEFPDVHPLLKGTVDFLFRDDTGLWLRDFKYGEGVPVSAEHNEQLLYYAYLAYLANPELRGKSELPVELGIVQPRYDPDNPIKTWGTDLGYVVRFAEEVLLPRMRSLTASWDFQNDDFNPGDWCRFCPVMLECPKAQEAFNCFADAALNEEAPMLTNEELSDFYGKRDLARKFMTELDNTVKSRLMTGQEIPGAKLVASRTNRIWKDGAEAVLIEKLGDAAWEPKKLKSPAAVEKIGKRGKDLALEWGFMPESTNYTVAPASDPRPSVKPPSGEDTFAGFTKGGDDFDF